MADLKVIGAGFPRTGTNSLKVALEILYGKPCYHMKEVIVGRGHHYNFWIEAAEAANADASATAVAKGTSETKEHSNETDPRTVDFDEVFHRGGKDFCATVDFPACLYWKDVLRQYPDAKVILTVRPDAKSWVNSCASTIWYMLPNGPFSNAFIGWGVQTAIKWGVPHKNHAKMLATLVKRAGLDASYTTDHWCRIYEAHNAAVIADCPKDRLLVFCPTDGWEPLCQFLGKEVPDVPYPRVNAKREFQTIVGVVSGIGWTVAASPVLVAALAAYCLSKRK